MKRHTLRVAIAVGVAILLVLLFGSAAARLYTDALWFGELGHGALFRTRLAVTVLVRLASGTLAAAIVFGSLLLVLRRLGPVHVRRRYGNLEIAEQVPRRAVIGTSALLAALAGWWLSSVQFGGAVPLFTYAWFRRESWGLADPLFGHDLSFYVFTLPVVFRAIDLALLAVLWGGFLAGVGYALVGALRIQRGRLEVDQAPRQHLAGLIAAVLVLLALRLWLGRYTLLLAGNGFGGSIGYTDVHARLPALAASAALALVAAAAVLWGAHRRVWVPPVVAIGAFLLFGLVGRAAWPALVQKLQVEPNQLAREARYIEWNLEFTRRAFGLHDLARVPLNYRTAVAADWSGNSALLATLPLWDPEPLRSAYTELQAPQRYYAFLDVDFDRYATGAAARQVAVGVREFQREGLRPGSRTWHNLHLNPQFTRGYGAVIAPADEAVGGQPVFWLGGVSPIQRHPEAPAEIQLRDPAVYFGESSAGYVVLEPDSAHAPGVPLSSFGRVLAFAWRFGDQNLLFARGLSERARILFRRPVLERLGTLVPFLEWDSDPMPILHEGGIAWLVDGYTISSTFPLARPLALEGAGTVRYLRPSVKALVDASSGAVVVYAVEAEPDPILATYRSLFPGLIRDAGEASEELRAHFRYPALALRIQGDVLEEYHLREPEAFYVGQDAWQLPQDITTGSAARPYRPVYLSARLPDAGGPEFLAVLPFIARQRQNLTALLAARNDPPHYGELVLLELPRDEQIRGPGQVQSLIEQQPAISSQLSLWRQRGTSVDIGRLRIVPLDSTLLYVRPLFLTAANQEGAIPQLQRVIV
ncbi:MAG TPA: UPF0182 family protein, partial [Longimicrobiales bacterium]|nr:UPF0182 family protein [Longimicrobiales bacterium]